MNKAVYVNWYNEELDKYYKEDRPDNEGLIHGVYFYDEDNEHIETMWFKTEKKRNNFFKAVKDFELIEKNDYAYF
jgi:hypothetical protein